MDAILTVDDAQRIVLFNQAAATMFGCASSEAIGQPLERFIPPRLRASHQGYMRAFGESRVTSRSPTSPAMPRPAARRCAWSKSMAACC